MEFNLRPWNINDLDSLVKYANNEKIAKFMTNKFPHPYTMDHGREFIEFATNESPANIMAIEIGGEASGGIGIHIQPDIYCRNAELGYWLGEPFWGEGVITAAIKQMVAYGFQNWELQRIYARPFGTNKGSQRALEKAGFELEGTFEKTIYKQGEYLDELIYSIRRVN